MPNPPTAPPREHAPPTHATSARPERTGAIDDDLGRAVLSSLPAHIAVLDRDGRIVAVNDAWTAFAAANDGGEGCGVGCNYIDVCRGAARQGSPQAGATEAQHALTGLRDVLQGKRPLFTMEYPCHSAQEKRWFLMTAAPLKRVSGGAGDELSRGAVVSHLNITDRKLSEQLSARLVVQVERHRRRVEELLANVPGVVWEAYGNPDAGAQHVDFVSDYVERMLGYSVTEWLEKPGFWLTVVHPDDRERAAKESAAIFAGGGEGSSEFRWVARDGRVLWVQSTSTVIRDEHGQSIGMRGVTMDVTTRRRAQRALRRRARQLARMTRQLQRSNEELDQFAYITSHDLRAPLRGIANLSTWIEEDLGAAMTPEARKQMELLRGRVHRMEALISGLLEYSRVGRVKGAPQSVDVGKLLAETIDLLAPSDGARVEVVGPMPTVPADRLRLGQVFMNVIGNALKHGRGAGVVPHVRVSARDAGRLVEFAVADNGPGVPPEYHERIFVIFQTLAPRDKVEGTGVGLALVKKVVEANGGTIRVESDPAAKPGATFAFTWPKEAKEG
jgi:PAS domain S-box-containing protein